MIWRSLATFSMKVLLHWKFQQHFNLWHLSWINGYILWQENYINVLILRLHTAARNLKIWGKFKYCLGLTILQLSNKHRQYRKESKQCHPLFLQRHFAKSLKWHLCAQILNWLELQFIGNPWLFLVLKLSLF